MAEDLILKLLTDKEQAPLRKVGAEFERMALNSSGQVTTYSRDLRPLLDELVAQHQWEVNFESEGKTLGLKKGRHYISLEPGAQLEIAAAPKESLLDVLETEQRILSEISQTQVAKGWTWIETGVNPWSRVDEIELIPSSRYRYMTDYFPQHAKRGTEMMRLTTGTHLNIDFYLEPEAIEMLRVSAYLSPFVTALFANSPYQYGKKTGHYSERAMIWKETDPLRCGWPEFFFESSCSLEDYADFVRSRPLMYFIGDEGQIERGRGETFDSLRPELQEKNALLAMRQIFTESRLKPCCVEIRCFDLLEKDFRYAALAFVLGLVYEDSIRQELNEEALEAGRDKTESLSLLAAKDSLENDFLFQKCEELYDRARSGLLKRGFGEEVLLEKAKPLLENRQSPAHLLLASKRLESWRS